ncbi:hypothetical protein [Hymenobacter arcticus]
MLQLEEMLGEALKQQLVAASSPADSVRMLQQFKASGGNQLAALRILEQLRSTAVSEQEEDKILELMDLVIGFCQPHRSIW